MHGKNQDVRDASLEAIREINFATATVEGGTEGVEELRRTSEERDGHAQWVHEG